VRSRYRRALYIYNKKIENSLRKKRKKQRNKNDSDNKNPKFLKKERKEATQ
jgi:hypothetical protein